MTPATRRSRFARRLIALLVPRDEREFFLGDLDERPPASWVREVRGALSLALGARPRPPRPPGRKGTTVLETLAQDLRSARRLMRRSPTFTAVAIFTMALGVGATTAIFSLVNGILVKPLPYDEPDRLVAIWTTLPGAGFDRFSQSAALHFTYEDHSRAVEDIGLWQGGTAIVADRGEAESEQVLYVTAGTLGALRMKPHIGRLFTRQDDSPTGPATVVLGYGYWQSRFAGDPNAIGQLLPVDGEPSEIIGVAPPGRFLSDWDPAIYLPLRIDRATTIAARFQYQSLARLAPGVSVDQAEADFARLVPAHVEAFPGGMTAKDLAESRLAPVVVPLEQEIVGGAGRLLWMLLGAAGLVLLIAVANVANLMLVQAEGRDREVAIRAAMGAGRRRMARQFIVESLCLGGGAGVLGLGLAAGGVQVLLALAPDTLPRLSDVSIDATVWLFTIGLSILVAIALGLVPVIRLGRADLTNALKEGGQAAGGRDRRRTRDLLASVQVALALVLLVCAGLLIRSLQKLADVSPGFGDGHEVLTLRVSIPSAEIPDIEAVARAHELVGARLSAIPSVSSVALTTKIPMGGGSNLNPMWVEGVVQPEGTPPPVVQFDFVGPRYFDTLRIPLVAGRFLTGADIHDRTRVVVVSETFARRYWDRPSDAVGKRISSGLQPGESGWWEIVGVAGDVRDAGLTEDAPALTYWPLVTPNPWSAILGETLFVPRTVYYAVRSPRVRSSEFLGEVRDAVASVAPGVPVEDVRLLDDIMARSTASIGFVLTMLGVAAGVALLLGVVGVYGVVSQVASRRTREIGVRMALGARPLDVKRLVLRQGLDLAAAGVGIGLAAAFWSTRLVEGYLFGVDRSDPVTYASVGAALAIVTVVASAVPAWRAAGVDPIRVLRSE